MARLGGKNGRIYMGLANAAATAEPVQGVARWSLNQTTDKPEVTALGDTNKVYVADLPDSSGSFEGFYDDATVQTYTAAQDGQPRKFYLYPNNATATQYWFGTVLPDFSVSGGVGDA